MNTFDEETMIALGSAQVDALFRRQADARTLLDDGDFVPFLEAVLTAFDTIGLSPAGVEALWHHAYTAYDRLCREAEATFTFEENRERMRGYLVSPRRSALGKTKKRSPNRPDQTRQGT